jgi:very-short-patch-repair endonuclease
VARTPFIPPELAGRPFTLAEARAAGLTKSALKGKTWRRLSAELYCRTELGENPSLLLSAWQRLLPAEAVFSSATAAWLLGLDLEPIDPVQIVVPPESGIRSRAGLSVRRCELSHAEVVSIRGLRATALPFTLAALCLERTAVEALVAIDMAVRAGLTDAAALGRYAQAAQGRPGAGKLRSLAQFAAPAESPMETRLRWLLIQAGLPRPEVQTNLHDSKGRFIGRADLYYPAAKLVLEYDGGNHRERLVEDDRRQNLLINAGFRLLRVTAADIHNRPDVVEAQVRIALGMATPNAPLAPTMRKRKRQSKPLTPKVRNRRRDWGATPRRLLEAVRGR